MNIGFFDSGLGGLSIYQNFLQYLFNHIKNLNYINHLNHMNVKLHYIADSKHAPYGLQSIDFIQKRCLEICQFFLTQKVDLIVIACNTATAHAIEILRQNPLFKNTPLVGVEPAVKPACLVSQNHKIGILATQNTLQSLRLIKLMEEQKHQHPLKNTTIQKLPLEFFLAEGKNWVELIESTDALAAITNHDPENQIWQRIQNSINPLIEHGIDTLILGCTHYPFLQKIIVQHIPNHIQIIDNADAITQQIMRLYQQKYAQKYDSHILPDLHQNLDKKLDKNSDDHIKISQYFYSNANLKHMQNFIEHLVLKNMHHKVAAVDECIHFDFLKH